MSLGVASTKPPAIVGVGATRYFERGQSAPLTEIEMAGIAVLNALDDAGLTIKDLDGLSFYSGGIDAALLAHTLGVPELRFSAIHSGGGGGAAGSIGIAAAAINAGFADVVVSLMVLMQGKVRRGRAFAPTSGFRAGVPTPERDFLVPSGGVSPGSLFSILAKRHMHLYGTKREHFGEVAIATRLHASTRDGALRRAPFSMDEYLAAPMVSDPLCVLDYCLESDGAVAIVTTSAERAMSLRRPPVFIGAASMGGHGRWGQSITWMNMPDEYFASSGHRPVAQRLYERAGVEPSDIDVALLYDHFTPMVLMQLEDYGFCPIGESGDFVAAGNIRWPNGSLPVNTHGGNLSEAFISGLTHVKEAVEQIRGSAVNQVAGAEVALVTGGPGPIPVSSLILRAA